MVYTPLIRGGGGGEDAAMYDKLSYKDLLTRDLKVVYASAISLARENSVPICFIFLKKIK